METCTTDVDAWADAARVIVRTAVREFAGRVTQRWLNPALVALEAIRDSFQIALAQQFGSLTFELRDALIGDVPI